MLKQVLLITFALAIGGCTTVPLPLEDYALARSAFEACKAVDAGRYSPGFFHRAAENYSRAETLYQEQEYAEARVYFIRARVDFEKAENSAQVQRKKSGEVL